MRIAVIGATGLIGSRIAWHLQAEGHEVVAASRTTGVNSYTGEGLEQALAGVSTVIDASNSGYIDARGANEFFRGSTLNLLNYGAAAGVRHHVALSVVGTDRLARAEGGYFAAKAAQEQLIQSSGHPFSIVHATQFFEFIRYMAEAAYARGTVRLANALTQPIAADDVVASTIETALGNPSNSIVEFAGPEQFRLVEVVRRGLQLRRDPREALADPLATYFGTSLEEDDLLPGPGVTIAPTRFADWLAAGGVIDHSTIEDSLRVIR